MLERVMFVPVAITLPVKETGPVKPIVVLAVRFPLRLIAVGAV